ncbi:hypothetical protein [Pseudomonas sp. TWP3-1]|uniref:hypothetical protein n=1 Tax=Pseudomonas sp. TWP3-1 TaxID=2804631 RepID=UPI003CF0CD7B
MAGKPPRKSRKMAVCLAVSLLINAGFLTVVALKVFGQRTDMLKTTEPLVIEANNDDDNVYVLPRGTTLYYEKSYPEGFSRYRVYFNHKGVIAGDPVRMEPKYWGTLIDPLWLANIDADTLKGICTGSGR